MTAENGDSSLAVFAVSETRSRGRRFAEPPPTYRGEFQRDRDRIIHSAAFRRLEYKTQVFVNHEGDLFRTRLTHSLEVAQIARTVARRLRLNEDLCEAISLAHDLGHTPFGHAGQEALNQCMSRWGGFEHNAQSVRVIDELEDKYAAFHGLNLMFETREGVLKHCSRKRARTLGDLGERFLQRRQASLEAQVANIADEIAYNNHDVDDGLRSQLLTVEALREVSIFDEHYRAAIAAGGTALTARQIRHETVRRIINTLVVDLTDSSATRLREIAPGSPDAVRALAGPLIGFSSRIDVRNRELKRFLNQQLYQHHQVYRMTVKAQRVVTELFEALLADSRLLPPALHASVERQEADPGKAGRARIVADYIAGMTDRFAIDEHERLFDPRRLR